MCLLLSHTGRATVKERNRMEWNVITSEEKREKKLWHEWFATTTTFPARYFKPTQHDLHVLRLLFYSACMYA